jgi:hypothetical protein
MMKENISNSNPPSNTTDVTKLRFLDIIFIVYYAFAFICFLLNFLGVTHFYETYFTASWFVFPLIIQLLATRLITQKELFFSKFPLSFKPVLRIIIILQFIIQHIVVLSILEYPSIGDLMSNPKVKFLICNGLIMLWSLGAIYQKFTTKKSKKGSDNK